MKPRWQGELTRRDFLRVGSMSAGTIGLGWTSAAGNWHAKKQDVNCIFLLLVGGPSQLETWDLKPQAPDFIRGPFRPIATSVPGIQISEHLPRMASLAHRYAIIRSVYHDASPIHETGHQLLQTGLLSHDEVEHPHIGAVLSYLKGPKANGVPPFAILPGPIANTGVSVSHGQSAGWLGRKYDPVFLAPEGSQRDKRLHSLANPITANDKDLDRYGRNRFGRCVLQARRLVEKGVRFVTVNMFDSVFDRLTWDCHADGGALGTTLQDYKEKLCPMLDAAFSALIEDLHDRGMLEETLVVAAGEFGRTPRFNARGGRDHWPGVWSVALAGGGIQGGQVLGASDRHGAEPHRRPVSAAMLSATIYRALGIDPPTTLAGPDGLPFRVVRAEPVAELFC
ncbi:MAG: hypothetical protein KatS3mg105_0691 [Gemmatales bacterium]|nr:MAG: hypothetical protein KatS3mg105_0691 [Gemmatales bacterium]